MTTPRRKTESRPVRVQDLRPVFTTDAWDEWLCWLSPANGQQEYSRFLRARRRAVMRGKT